MSATLTITSKKLPDMTPRRPPGIANVVKESEEVIEAEIRLAEDFLRVSRRYLDELRSIGGQHTPRSGPPRISPKSQVIDAVLTFLDQAGAPQPLDAIVEKMVDWGVNANVYDQRQQIRKSITYHLLSKEEKRQRWRHVKALPAKLKKVGDLIGRAEWNDGHGTGEK